MSAFLYTERIHTVYSPSKIRPGPKARASFGCCRSRRRYGRRGCLCGADHSTGRQCCCCFCGVTSLGRTTTYPSPWSISCTASPEPPRSIEPMDCDRCSEVCRWAVQPTTASVSTYTGCCGETGITSGLPSHTRPSLPCPVKTLLNRPPPAMPEPLTVLISYDREALKHSTLRPLTVNSSPGST